MPQYHLGHVQRVAHLETMASQVPGLILAGNAYHGVGIPDCIHSGENAARAVLTHVSAMMMPSPAP
jgi:oxygen-dependent protoporphyrinogen oxidase